MYKKTKKIAIALSLISIMLLVSCEKGFDDINTDPNAIVDVPADFLLPGSILSISNAENGFMENLIYSSDWVQHTSGGTWVDPGRYFFEKSRSYMWDQLYSGPLMDLKVMKAKAQTDKNAGLEAVAMILQSYAYSLLVDIYGPIPYTQSLSAEAGINKPEYDDGEMVYKSVIDSLDRANQMLANYELHIQEGYDLLCDGDAMKWRKLCNSLKLKLLVRSSGQISEFSKSRLEGLYNNAEYPILEGNNDNITFRYPATSPTNYHPLHSALSTTSSDGGYRLSKSLVDVMSAISDPRLQKYAIPNEQGDIIGLQNGEMIGASDLDTYAKIHGSYGLKNRSAIFMNYSEVKFLLAEAAEKNLINADAEQLYQEAIQANFEELGLNSDQYNEFVAKPGVAYTGYERLMTQKWISLFGRGIEAWSEYRRSGIPNLSPALNSNLQSIPARFLYPLSEEQSNNANLQSAILKLSNGDALNSKIWWMN